MFLRNILNCCIRRIRCRLQRSNSSTSFPEISQSPAIVSSAARQKRSQGAGVPDKQRRTIRAICRISFRPVLIAATQLAAPATFGIGRTAHERRGPPSPFVSFARARRNSVIAFWIGSSELRGFPDLHISKSKRPLCSFSLLIIVAAHYHRLFSELASELVDHNDATSCIVNLFYCFILVNFRRAILNVLLTS